MAAGLFRKELVEVCALLAAALLPFCLRGDELPSTVAFCRLGRGSTVLYRCPEEARDCILRDETGKGVETRSLGPWRHASFPRPLAGPLRLEGRATSRTIDLPPLPQRPRPSFAVELDWFLKTEVREGPSALFPVQVDYRFGPGKELGLERLWNSSAGVVWAYFNPAVEPSRSWIDFVETLGRRGRVLHLLVTPTGSVSGTVDLRRTALASVDRPWVRLFLQYRFLAAKGVGVYDRAFRTLHAVTSRMAPKLAMAGAFTASYDNAWFPALAPTFKAGLARSLCMRFVSSDVDMEREWRETMSAVKALPASRGPDVHVHLGWFREEKADGGLVTLVEGFQSATPLTTFDLALGHRLGEENLGRELGFFLADLAFIVHRAPGSVTPCWPAIALHEGVVSTRMMEAHERMESLFGSWKQRSDEAVYDAAGTVTDWRCLRFAGNEGSLFVLFPREGTGGRPRPMRIANLFGPVQVHAYEARQARWRQEWTLCEGHLDVDGKAFLYFVELPRELSP